MTTRPSDRHQSEDDVGSTQLARVRPRCGHQRRLERLARVVRQYPARVGITEHRGTARFHSPSSKELRYIPVLLELELKFLLIATRFGPGRN